MVMALPRALAHLIERLRLPHFDPDPVNNAYRVRASSTSSLYVAAFEGRILAHHYVLQRQRPRQKR